MFVFENRPGSGSVAHRGKKAASVLCRALSFEFRAHDLRRTAATRVYDRYNYDAEKRDALDRWARGLAAIIEGKTKKVVAFRA